MTEHDVQNSVRLALSDLGWCVFRVNTGRVQLKDGRWFSTGVPKGFSDLFAVKNGKAVFIEVKDETGRVRPEQEHFLKTMRERYGCRAGVVRNVNDAIKLCEGGRK